MSKSPTLVSAKKNKFSVILDRVPELSSLLATVDFPEASIGSNDVSYKGMMVESGGAAAKFGDITLNFRIDEAHNIVDSILTWMFSSQINNEVNSENNTSLETLKSDLYLLIQNNNSNTIKKYIFVGCVPINFTKEEYNRSSADELVGSLTLSFDYFRTE